jgi:EipB-like
MSRAVRFCVAVALLVPHLTWAQMQPHRAEYSLRLGTAANAPRIGTAMQDITLDCAGWHIRRDIASEIAFTPSLKVSLASRFDGEEDRNGNAFRYHNVQIQNGAERDTRGKVRRVDGETSIDVVSPDGTQHLVLPPPTLMPVAAVSHLVDRLHTAGAASFPAFMFGAEATGDAFLVDVRELDRDALQAAPPALKPVAVPATRSWAVLMTLTRPRQQDEKPLLSVRARVFSSGVLDRLTVDAGVVTVTADLLALEMHEPPVCPSP